MGLTRLAADLYISTGFIKRRMAETESDHLEKCMNIFLEAAESYVYIFSEERRGKADPSDVVTVRSFRDAEVSYKLSFTNPGLVSGCSCQFMTRNLIVCKHIVWCMSGYGIDFDTRYWDKPVGSQFSPAPAKGPTEERVNIKETVKRLHQMIDSVVIKRTNLHDLSMFEEGVKYARR